MVCTSYTCSAELVYMQCSTSVHDSVHLNLCGLLSKGLTLPVDQTPSTPTTVHSISLGRCSFDGGHGTQTRNPANPGHPRPPYRLQPSSNCVPLLTSGGA
jgi:hypothetical protein